MYFFCKIVSKILKNRKAIYIPQYIHFTALNGNTEDYFVYKECSQKELDK